MDQHPSAISSLFNLRWDQHLHRLTRAPAAHFLPRFVETIPPKKGKKCWKLETILGFLLGSPTVVSYKLLELLMSSISDLIIVLAKAEPTTGQGGLNYCLEA
jgi:hypothetical protein